MSAQPIFRKESTLAKVNYKYEKRQKELDKKKKKEQKEREKQLRKNAQIQVTPENNETPPAQPPEA